MVLGIVDYNSHEAPRVGVVAKLEGGPRCSWVGRWRRRLSVCRTEGNFTAAAGVVSDVINLSAGKECATGINAKSHSQQLVHVFSGRNRSLQPVFPLSKISSVSVFLNCWNTFSFLNAEPRGPCSPACPALMVCCWNFAKSQPVAVFPR